MDGKLIMGTKLNTEELSRQLGVSRMPIREALKSLEKMSLAESIPYVGTRIVLLGHSDLHQIYLMRQLLEPLAAENACDNISDKDIEKLEKIHEEYINIVTSPEPNAKMVYLQNRTFHFFIYSFSNMQRVCATIESLWDTLSFFKLIYGHDLMKTREGIQTLINEHQYYIDALKQRDKDGLKKKLSDNLQKRIDGISEKKDFNIW
jgi:DNA-binding GntR family transcriptional regulator